MVGLGSLFGEARLEGVPCEVTRARLLCLCESRFGGSEVRRHAFRVLGFCPLLGEARSKGITTSEGTRTAASSTARHARERLWRRLTRRRREIGHRVGIVRFCALLCEARGEGVAHSAHPRRPWRRRRARRRRTSRARAGRRRRRRRRRRSSAGRHRWRRWRRRWWRLLAAEAR